MSHMWSEGGESKRHGLKWLEETLTKNNEQQVGSREKEITRNVALKKCKS